VILAFSIPGEPGHSARMRAAVIHGHARVYQPKQNVISTKIIQDYAMQAMNGARPLEGPIAIEIRAYYLYPASWSGKQRERSGGWKTSRPDCDNIIKIIKDSLNAICWRDDAQVVCEWIEKRYSETARTEIRIELLTVEQPQRAERHGAEQGALI
jgi:Holliday junction resolvase RusA-like endonuclease